jgi:hypothetical protein
MSLQAVHARFRRWSAFATRHRDINMMSFVREQYVDWRQLTLVGRRNIGRESLGRGPPHGLTYVKAGGDRTKMSRDRAGQRFDFRVNGDVRLSLKSSLRPLRCPPAAPLISLNRLSRQGSASPTVRPPCPRIDKIRIDVLRYTRDVRLNSLRSCCDCDAAAAVTSPSSTIMVALRCRISLLSTSTTPGSPSFINSVNALM